MYVCFVCVRVRASVSVSAVWQVLHCAWHPSEPCVAVGACNTVYVYYNDEGKL